MLVLLCFLCVAVVEAGVCGTIGEVKAQPQGTLVCVTGSVTYIEPTECYIESADRSAGIWVQADTSGIVLADLVSASGTLGIANGERVIQSATLSLAGVGPAIAPLGVRNNWLGGFYQAGTAALQDFVAYRIPDDGTGRRWQAAAGASTIGLLATTWGRVNAVYYSPITNAHWFYIDDGSGVVSDCGDLGVIVYSGADVHQGDCVTVTGVSSIELSFDDATRLVRSIRPRSGGDVRFTGAGQQEAAR